MNEVIQSIKSKLSFALRHLIHFRPHSIKWRSLSSLIPKLLSILGPRPAGPSPLAAGARPRLARLRIPSNLTKALSFETYIKRLSFVNRAGFASSVALFIISLLIIFPIYYKTNLAEAADGSSSTVLSISSDNLTAAMDLLVTSNSGTFAASDPLSFNVTTTNSSGYTLSLKSKSGSTDLTNTSVDGTGTSVSGTFTSITNASGISADIFSDSSNTAYNNHWGIKPSHYESIANSDGLYYPSPDNDGVILNATDSANTSGSSDTYTIAIGARATYAQPAGTYTNTYILSAVGNIALIHTLSITNGSNISSSTGAGEYSVGEEVELTATSTSNTTCLTYGTPAWTAKASDGSAATGYFKSTNSTTATGTSVTYVMGSTDDVLTVSSTRTRKTYAITYNNNGGTGTMSNTTGSCGAATTLRTNTFTRSGYDFLGWSTSNTATSATYTDKQSVTLSRTSVLALYAVWKSSCVTTVSGTMQSFNPCSTVANGTSGSLTDSRDGQIYTVKKINGQWWMTRNLAIGCNGSGSSYGSRVSSESLTSANSNVSTNFSTPTALLSAASSSTETADYSAGRMQCSSTYGAWYNYYAASAGTVSGSSNSKAATKDICPLNWHLPTGPSTTSGTDFNKLVGNTTDGWQNPTDGLKVFGAVAGGRYSDGSLSYSGRGHWWSATAYSATGRNYLYYNSDNGHFDGGGGYSRFAGAYVRCVHD